MASSTQAQAPHGIVTLSDLRDHARPLLIFAGRPDDPQLEIQIRTLQEHAAEAQDRELVPIAVVYNNPSPTNAKLTADEAETVRNRFHVQGGEFTVILLGKDGGEKLRSAKPLPMEKLTQTIDTMPMRREEVRERSH